MQIKNHPKLISKWRQATSLLSQNAVSLQHTPSGTVPPLTRVKGFARWRNHAFPGTFCWSLKPRNPNAFVFYLSQAVAKNTLGENDDFVWTETESDFSKVGKKNKNYYKPYIYIYDPLDWWIYVYLPTWSLASFPWQNVAKSGTLR